MSNKKFTSIIEDLANIVPKKDTELFIESRAIQAIAATTNLFRLIEEQYQEDVANDLKRRFINSIKSDDVDKFKRKIHQIRGEKNKK